MQQGGLSAAHPAALNSPGTIGKTKLDVLTRLGIKDTTRLYTQPGAALLAFPDHDTFGRLRCGQARLGEDRVLKSEFVRRRSRNLRREVKQSLLNQSFHGSLLGLLNDNNKSDSNQGHSVSDVTQPCWDVP